MLGWTVDVVSDPLQYSWICVKSFIKNARRSIWDLRWLFVWVIELLVFILLRFWTLYLLADIKIISEISWSLLTAFRFLFPLVSAITAAFRLTRCYFTRSCAQFCWDFNIPWTSLSWLLLLWCQLTMLVLTCSHARVLHFSHALGAAAPLPAICT